MKVSLRALFAHVCAGLALLSVGSAQADEQITAALFAGNEGSVEHAAFAGDQGKVDLVQFQSSGGPKLDLCGTSGCSHQLVVGAEYLMVRANHSQQLAFVEDDQTGANPVFRIRSFDFDYTSSYRVYAGIRIPECGQEFRFTYTNFNSDGSATSQAQQSPNFVIAIPWEVAILDGQSFQGSGSVELNNFDIACMKTIPLGCALGCCDTGCGDCCDDCGDCCDSGCCGCGCGCWCPAWDITWSGAVRVADVGSQLNYGVNTGIPNNTGPSGVSRVDFQGVGLRSGVLGRRYFGKTGASSLYCKFDVSLLVGDLDHSIGGPGTQLTLTEFSATQVIPVTELEAGATLALTSNLNVTGGYMISAWHDLGHRMEYDNFSNITGAANILNLDDANILAFDGWFVRAEATF